MFAALEAKDHCPPVSDLHSQKSQRTRTSGARTCVERIWLCYVPTIVVSGKALDAWKRAREVVLVIYMLVTEYVSGPFDHGCSVHEASQVGKFLDTSILCSCTRPRRMPSINQIYEELATVCNDFFSAITLSGRSLTPAAARIPHWWPSH
jgi:hypothetical protein